MIEGTITKTGANVLGGDMPGQVYFGVQGPPGGHYIPNVNQIADDTAEISFTPSTNNMPSVDPVQIKLPKNKESGGNVDVSIDGETLVIAENSSATIDGETLIL